MSDGGVNALSGLRFDFVAGWRRLRLIRLAVRFCRPDKRSAIRQQNGELTPRVSGNAVPSS
ncbi:hypothetical protein FD428_03225 [Citrobacter sp. TBCP-5362]|nr:hypothetical protein EGX86_09235 [Citrobacter koseri]QCQ73514.1 hypothetical protein FD428_03225 [Citrobacter sp. TBCP-5362]QEU26208.1 hypothetical protein FOB54_16685 [Citrobacter koseri]